MLALLVATAQGDVQRLGNNARDRALQAQPYDETPCKAWCGMPDKPKPMKCGVFWFLHVPKTGGTTLMSYFKQQAPRYGWKYADMWQMKVEKEDARPGPIHWGSWNKTAKWQSVLAELAEDHPKLLVHTHHNMPGLGNRYFVTEVLAPLAQKLAKKGCELRFATVLRDAVEHVKSAAFFGRVRNRRQMERYGPRNANPMTKYVSYNFQSQWPTGFKWFPNPDGVDEKLLASAQQILSNFSLVGRTEDLGTFVKKMNVVLGWPEDDTAERENTTPLANHYKLGASEITKLQEYNKLDNTLYNSFCVGSKASLCASRAAKPVGANPTLLGGIIELPYAALSQQADEDEDTTYAARRQQQQQQQQQEESSSFQQQQQQQQEEGGPIRLVANQQQEDASWP